MRKFLVALLVIAVVVLGAFPAAAQTRDIVRTAGDAGDFSTLLTLVEAAGLTEALQADGPLTVFAPTNQAFENLLTSTGLTLDELLADENAELLTSILAFHVLDSQPIIDANNNGVGKAELRAAYDTQPSGVLTLTTLSGEDLTLQFTAEDRIILNDQPISVNVENIVATNGVIHAINGVLLPPSLRNADGTATFGARATAMDLLAEDPDNFSSLIGALETTGLAEALRDTDQQFTVFAPTNAALQAASAELQDEDLTEILSLHVLPGEFTFQDIQNEMATRGVNILLLETLSGESITLQINADGTLLLNGQGITVTSLDNQIANGVVHYIPAVMFPRAGLTLTAQIERDSSFSVLEAALAATGLDEKLADTDAEFTLLAPTDDAFANLLARTGLTEEELLAETELLTTILTFHVLEGSQDARSLIATYAANNTRVLEVETVGGEILSLQVNNDDNILLGEAGTIVSVADIPADNGLVHALPAVLLPHSLRDDQGRPTFGERTTVVDHLSEGSDFSILASLLKAQGLTETLAGDGPFTVFAPTNGALQAAQGTLSGLSAEQTTTALTFHVLEGTFTRADIETAAAADADGIVELETLSGEILTLQIQQDGTIVMNGQGITPFLFNQGTVNGVIHGIPGVLLPPSLQ